MSVTKEDIVFIAEKTKLSVRKAKLLMEEENDLNLVVNELSSLDVTHQEIQKLSFTFIVKFIIFKFSKELNCPLNEKEYICRSILNHFPYISRSKIPKSIPKEITEEFVQYALILIGFFSHRLKAGQYKGYRDSLKNLLNEEKTRDLYYRVDDWLQIFNKMKTDSFFS